MPADREEHVREAPAGSGASASPRPVPKRLTVSPAALADRVLSGDRGALARAISIVESHNPRHRAQADELLERVMPRTGGALRLGLTGVPGVGKSTFIERLGTMLTSGKLGEPQRVAVLAIDPSSTLSGGSILGDKTRMAGLSGDPDAFVRPSPSSGTLGGVASKTRESMLLCEAAGFGVVIVETVGVGQSETAVAGMTDVFLALMLPNAGDELQGIKRGLLELADLVAVNKADGENALAARRAASEHVAALGCMSRAEHEPPPVVLTCSAKLGDGVPEVWEAVEQRVGAMRASGALESRRAAQTMRWLDETVGERLREAFENDPGVMAARARVRAGVREGTMTVGSGASVLMDAFLRGVLVSDGSSVLCEKDVK